MAAEATPRPVPESQEQLAREFRDHLIAGDWEVQVGPSILDVLDIMACAGLVFARGPGCAEAYYKLISEAAGLSELR
jgi:hypothetical protein